MGLGEVRDEAESGLAIGTNKYLILCRALLFESLQSEIETSSGALAIYPEENSDCVNLNPVAFLRHPKPQKNIHTY